MWKIAVKIRVSAVTVSTQCWKVVKTLTANLFVYIYLRLLLVRAYFLATFRNRVPFALYCYCYFFVIFITGVSVFSIITHTSICECVCVYVQLSADTSLTKDIN